MVATEYSIKEMVEDVLENGELTKEDVQEIWKFIRNAFDLEALVEIQSITHELDWSLVHHDIIHLLVFGIKKVFYNNGSIDDINAKELISLFDPEEGLNPFERKALEIIKSEERYGTILRDYFDDNLI